MITVLVTGSTGFIGSNLVKLLAQKKNYNVIGAVENPDGYTDKYECNEYLHTISNDDLLNGKIKNIDTVVNFAFARSSDAALLANSLDFTSKLAVSLKTIGIGSLINISSQGVYRRLQNDMLQTEDSDIEPIDIYSMAKYASEQIFNVSDCAPYITNVRLASINMKQRFLYKFVKQIISGKDIILTTPNQQAALLDVKDAVSGIKSIVDLHKPIRKPVYNLGINNQTTIFQYAQKVVEVLSKKGYSGKVIIQESNVGISNSGMDCSQIINDTGWEPKVTIEDMIQEYYYYIINGGE